MNDVLRGYGDGSEPMYYLPTSKQQVNEAISSGRIAAIADDVAGYLRITRPVVSYFVAELAKIAIAGKRAMKARDNYELLLVKVLPYVDTASLPKDLITDLKSANVL